MAKKSYLEIYTKAYVKGHGVKSLSKKSLQHALTLISEKLNSSCCADADATIDLSTYQNSNFLSGFEGMLKQVTRKGNIDSLTRTKNFIQAIIDGNCCL